jgi:hypothetical protein
MILPVEMRLRIGDEGQRIVRGCEKVIGGR